MKRQGMQVFRRNMRSIENTIDAAVAEVKAERKAEWEAAKAAKRAADAERHRFTRDELVGVKGVRDKYGWHPVVRVNAKTVTVKTPYSWTETVAFDRILEVME